MKKISGIILTYTGITAILLSIGFGIKCHYEYTSKYQSMWELADMSSTADLKLQYIDEFIKRLETSGLKGEYNALILKSPDESFDNNLNALKSLQQRLHKIKAMDPALVEYQLAMQQITQQEMGEANQMLSVFSGCFVKRHYFLLWNTICLLQVIISIACICTGIILWFKDY